MEDNDESSTSCCANCGVAEEDLPTSLLRCVKCKNAVYCSRDCQVAHWRAHKIQCKITANLNANPQAVRELMSMGRNKPEDAEDEERRKREMKELAKSLRDAERSGETPDLPICPTKYGPVGRGLPVPDGVPPNIHLKLEADAEYFKGAASQGSDRLGNLKGELAYKRYYDDIVKNDESRAEWLQFLSEMEHKELAEHTVGMFGSLAMIYRKRGNFEQCEEVLNVQDEVFVSYRKAIDGEIERYGAYATKRSVWCYDTLRMKSAMIRLNLYMQTGRYEECIPIYKLSFDYELNYDVPYEDQHYLFLLPHFLKKSPTREVVDSLTDEEIMKLVMRPVKSEGGLNSRLNVEREKEKLALEKCACCGKSEEALRQFKECQRCKDCVYCSRDCQKKHWKKHKKTCGRS